MILRIPGYTPTTVPPIAETLMPSPQPPTAPAVHHQQEGAFMWGNEQPTHSPMPPTTMLIDNMNNNDDNDDRVTQEDRYAE